ncbi:hypothetical protein G6F37_012747 [Rhizopus arrhizus]|nr:hypothetical protein G6F38_012725 [Rhizopus arrhizus]KAG1141835.1 hypothetical protein G6F37_012747 [Rhizopus arrhizus]
MSPQLQWEEVKSKAAKVIRHYSIEYVDWRTQSIKALEKKRNRLLRTKPPPAVRLHLLPTIDQQLHKLQQELAEIAILKSGIRWQEKGESNVKYLKNIHKKRTSQQFMTGFKDSNAVGQTMVQCDTAMMKNTVQQFYQHLYRADNVSQ